MIQLSSLKTSYQNYKQDITDVSNELFIEWCNYILSFIYTKIVNSDPDKLFTTQTINVVAGTTHYALNSNFRDVARFGSGLYPTDSTGAAVGNPFPYTGYASSSGGYYIENDDIVITPTPQKSDTYILRYIPNPPAFTALTDYFSSDKTSTGTPLLRDEDREFLIRALDVQYSMWDEDLSIEPIADQRFVRILSEMLSRQRSTPNAYSLNSYIGSF